MTVTLKPSPIAYQACLEEALQQAPLMAKRWHAILCDLLFEKSTAPAVIHEKNQIHDAWLALKKHQAEIERGFAEKLARAIDSEIQVASLHAGGQRSGRPGFKASSLRFQDLELMGDDQVRDTLDEARLTQTLLLVSEAGLAGLSARLSSAQGLTVVRANMNPLRPEVYSNALIQVLQALPIESGVKTRWLIYGGQILGELLQSLYVKLDQLLEMHGVQLAGYAVLLSPEEPRRISASERAHGSGALNRDLAQPEVYATPLSAQQPMQPGLPMGREKLLTLDHLHRLLTGDYNDTFNTWSADLSELIDDSANSHDPLAAMHGARVSFSPSMSAPLLALAELKQNSAGQLHRTAQLPATPSNVALVRESLKNQSRSLGQLLAIEVVGLMIEQLGADERLLPQIRQVISDAEPAFLRIGTADPQFFSDKNHPARRLLEVITAKSLAFASQDDIGFAEFLHDLQATFKPLLHDKILVAQDFAGRLQDFEDRLALKNQAVAAAQKLAVHALIQAEQRNLLAEKIALEIRQRPDFVVGNATLAAFMTGPWAQVVAKERLVMQGDTAYQQQAVYSLALGDMLWSLNPDLASRQRKRLLKIIPDMLNKVREGLLTIDFPLSQSKPFFDELMRLHQQALAAPPEKAGRSTVNSGGLADAFAMGDALADSQTWLQPTEAQQSGFMDFADTAPEPTRPIAKPGVSNPSAALTSDATNLLLGTWVDMVAYGHWLRAQLTWISPYRTLFMFTSSDGRSHSMTNRMLEQLVLQNCFRVISDHGLLDGALDSVAQVAVRNSVQGRPSV
jgi:hypothetical protein